MDLVSHESTHRVVVDDVTGMPVRLSVDHPNGVASETHDVQFLCTIEVELGGIERRGATGGLEYADTVRISDPTVTGRIRVQESPAGRTWRVPIAIGGISAELLYRFNRLGPALSLGFDFVGEQTVVVRNSSRSFPRSLFQLHVAAHSADRIASFSGSDVSGQTLDEHVGGKKGAKLAG